MCYSLHLISPFGQLVFTCEMDVLLFIFNVTFPFGILIHTDSMISSIYHYHGVFHGFLSFQCSLCASSFDAIYFLTFIDLSGLRFFFNFYGLRTIYAIWVVEETLVLDFEILVKNNIWYMGCSRKPWTRFRNSNRLIYSS